MRPSKRRHFGTGLREAEDVVHEEQHVLALIAEIFGDRQARKADARARARRLVHLAVHQRAFRAFGRALLRILVHAGFDHLVIEVVAFARALADAGEHRIAAMLLGDVVDEFLNEHGLAHAGAAEQSDLAAARIRREQIDDLDAGDEHLRFRRLIDEGGRFGMDGAALREIDLARFVHRLADDVHDAPERAVADGHGDRRAHIRHLLAAHQTFGGIHRDGAHRAFAQMLRHFQHEALAAIVGFQRVHDFRQMAVELHVHHRAHHLGDAALLVAFRHGVHGIHSNHSASAPEMISISSLVIMAWRVRLYCSVSLSITSPALRVAESMALILAPISPATFSSSARKICTLTLRGRRSARISASSGS